MPKKLLALLLMLAMLVIALSSCSGNTVQTTAESGQTATVESTETAEVPETSVESTDSANPEAPPDEKQPDSNSDPEPAGQGAGPTAPGEDTFMQVQELPDSSSDGNVSVKGITYTYPLEGERKSITIWNTINTNLTFIDKISDYKAFDAAEEAINIHVDWTECGQGVASEKLNLMIVGGEYTDLICNFNEMNFAGTLASAYDDEVIMDITEYVEQYCPNYSAWIYSSSDYYRDTRNDDGQMFAWYALQAEMVAASGNWIRADYLDALGMDVPITYSDYEAFFDAIITEFGCTSPIMVNQDGYASVAIAGWDMAAGGDNLALYQIDGQVTSSYLQEEFYDYLCMVNDWYNKGYIYKDFMSVTGAMFDATANSLVTSGNCALWSGWNNSYDSYKATAEQTGWDAIGVAAPVKNDGDVTHFGNATRLNTMLVMVMSTQAGDPETCCRYLDWWYTDAGINVFNYGEEGVCWTWDENGERQWTDLILNNPDGLRVTDAKSLYSQYSNFIGITDEWNNRSFYSDTVVNAMNTWSAESDSDYTLPTSSITLTVDESQTVNSISSDITTYASEVLAKFVVGDTLLDEAHYSEFVDGVKALRLEEIISIYQDAYERYLER